MYALSPKEGPVESNFNFIQSPLSVPCVKNSYKDASRYGRKTHTDFS